MMVMMMRVDLHKSKYFSVHYSMSSPRRRKKGVFPEKVLYIYKVFLKEDGGAPNFFGPSLFVFI